ncbi:glutamate/tyrosine decarboxylase-like PLP-dependent enzyme [Labrenzia sp. EL_162]|nr:glutamate/tyrosine decarboxylase-like PLP-dependent enzyme [Labrenzia sp. EL_162]
MFLAQRADSLNSRHCGIARQIADRLQQATGVRIVNDVVLNQVIVSFGEPGLDLPERNRLTEAVIETLRSEGSIFVGGARWREEWVMRISVICNATMPADADLVADIILDAWKAVSGSQE